MSGLGERLFCRCQGPPTEWTICPASGSYTHFLKPAHEERLSAQAEPRSDDPWPEYLRSLRRLIVHLWEAGESPERISELLRMEPFQVIVAYQRREVP